MDTTRFERNRSKRRPVARSWVAARSAPAPRERGACGLRRRPPTPLGEREGEGRGPLGACVTCHENDTESLHAPPKPASPASAATAGIERRTSGSRHRSRSGAGLPDGVGRAGIEPATLGLKVDATGFACSRSSSQGGLVKPIGSGDLGCIRNTLLTCVDPNSCPSCQPPHVDAARNRYAAPLTVDGSKTASAARPRRRCHRK